MAGRGVELDLVASRGGRVEIADIEAAMRPSTRVVALSSVQEVSGYRIDVSALAALCHERAIVLVVDGAQHVGALPLDVHAAGIDVLAVGGHKWLGAPFGLGLLYVRRELLETAEPPTRGYMTMEEPVGGWGGFLSDPERVATSNFRFARSASALEIGGTGPYLAATAFAACLDVLLELGIDAIAERVHGLGQLLVAGASELGLDLVSPRAQDERGPFVVIGVPGGVEANRSLLALLTGHGVAVSLRYAAGVGGIRVSPHFYTDEEDVARFLALAEEFVAGPGRLAR